MKTKEGALNVLYQSDDNYAMVSGISIASLLSNNRHVTKINIYYCDYNISQKNRKRLIKLVADYKNARLHFIDAEPYHEIFQELGVKPWHGVYVTWLKLLAFGDLARDMDEVLFINGHTIVNGPLDELIHFDFEDSIMALAYDCLTNTHKLAIGLGRGDGYFNCGIMLINTKKWREDSTTERLKSHLKNKSDYLIADQDLCNVLFKGEIKLLESTYNFSSAYYAYDIKKLLKVNNLQPNYFYNYEDLMSVYYSPKIIHSLFGVKGKPWEEGNDHPQKYLWEKYLNMTPWKKTKRTLAKHTLIWKLYDLLPQSLFLKLYIVAVRRKFG